MLKKHDLDLQATLSSPIGKIGVITSADDLLAVRFLDPAHPIIKPKTLVAKNVVEELLCYFADPTYKFTIPMHLNVSNFQHSVLDALRTIPLGSTQNYAELANQLKSGARAVGNACRKNPIPIIIPCHRIVAKRHIGGYSGNTRGPLLDIKRWLLNHENTY